jgi:hypothetical protein
MTPLTSPKFNVMRAGQRRGFNHSWTDFIREKAAAAGDFASGSKM